MRRWLGKLALGILVAAALFAAGYYLGVQRTSLPYGFTWESTEIVGPSSVTDEGEEVHGFVLKDNKNNKKYLIYDDGNSPLDLSKGYPDA